mgnify:CR=1 FL=1
MDKNSGLLAKLHSSNILLYLFGISFVLYLLTKSVLFAFLSGASLIGTFVLDILVGAMAEGWKKEIIEVAKAFAVALILWFGVQLILGTSVPISGVVSCSLLPSYERGDFVIVQGIEPKDISAQTVEISEQELESLLETKVGCGQNGPLTFSCQQMCPRISSSTKEVIGYSPECVRSIIVNSTLGGMNQVNESLANDVIVYATRINGTYINMDIVHRVFLKLKVNDSYYILTKGDNNNYMDVSYFDIVREQDVKGKVIFRIPILGYVKLFISGPQFYGEPEGCDTILLH